MKNNVKYLFCLSALLLLASSFVRQSIAGHDSALYGGAYVLFAGKFGGEITTQEIQGQTEITVDGCARGSRIFELSLSITKNGKTSTLTTTSGILTSEMRSKLKSLTKGDEFEFQNTKAYWGGNSKDVVQVRGKKFLVV